jgi:cold shock CspA family protein
MAETGVICNWVKDRGFGFARYGQDKESIFVHISELVEEADALPVGTKISFEKRESKRKPGYPAACQVEVLEWGQG